MQIKLLMHKNKKHAHQETSGKKKKKKQLKVERVEKPCCDEGHSF